MSWEFLPLDVRLVILEAISCNVDTAAYAAVCREWQVFFEKKHFERIILSQRRIKTFTQIVQGAKRKLVKHIWLRLELKTYRCPQCMEPESCEIQEENNTIFVKSLKTLLQALSTWDKSSDLHREGLALELSAYSPSDSKHFFRDVRFDHDPYHEPSEDFIIIPNSKSKERKFNDRWHLWRQGHRTPISRVEEDCLERGISRLQGCGFYFKRPPYGIPNDDRPPHSASDYLPKVEVVTSFHFRRQYYRYIHPDGLIQLFESLIGLQHIIYEPPKALCDSKRYQFVFECWLPVTLRKLTIYASHNDRDEAKYLLDSSGLLLPRSNAPALGLALAKASQPLEHLAASFIVDATHFLAFVNQRQFPSSVVHGQENNWHWANLRSLALTSKLLAPDQTPPAINDLLLAASVAARAMPALRVMEIWNGKNKVRTLGRLKCEDDELEYGCFFRYYVEDDLNHSQGKSSRVSVRDWDDVPTDNISTATITWHSTWCFELEQRVVQSWKCTVQGKGGQGLSFETELLPMDSTRFPASILHHLKLRDQVLHSVSYQQIKLLCTAVE
ncbi:hypothetical protein F5884DRAFT_849067 [Xylogone sp. PMI_703]|nr:hypothetical protein F5884DRAFT_849067 [Xylogone sp. PMI_703]